MVGGDIVDDGPYRGERKDVAGMANELAELAEGMDAGNERSLARTNNGTAKMTKAEEREGIVALRRWMKKSSLWGLLPTGGQLALEFKDSPLRHLTRFLGAARSLFQNFLGERKHVARQAFPQNRLLDELRWVDRLAVVQFLARRVSFNASNGPTGHHAGRHSTGAALLPLLQRTQRITGSRHRTR